MLLPHLENYKTQFSQISNRGLLGDCEASAGLLSKILKLIVNLSELCAGSAGLLDEDRSHRRCYYRRFGCLWYYLHLQGQTVYEMILGK